MNKQFAEYLENVIPGMKQGTSLVNAEFIRAAIAGMNKQELTLEEARNFCLDDCYITELEYNRYIKPHLAKDKIKYVDLLQVIDDYMKLS